MDEQMKREVKQLKLRRDPLKEWKKRIGVDSALIYFMGTKAPGDSNLAERDSDNGQV